MCVFVSAKVKRVPAVEFSCVYRCDFAPLFAGPHTPLLVWKDILIYHIRWDAWIIERVTSPVGSGLVERNIHFVIFPVERDIHPMAYPCSLEVFLSLSRQKKGCDTGIANTTNILVLGVTLIDWISSLGFQMEAVQYYFRNNRETRGSMIHRNLILVCRIRSWKLYGP